MYAEFFGLCDQPFNDTWDPRFFYSTEVHEDTSASLIYAVGSLKGLMVLTGEAGTGKTLACQRMLTHFGQRIAFAELGRTPLHEDNLFALMCAEFGIESTEPGKDGQPPAAMQDFLIEQFVAARPTVLIIDDAHFLSIGTLEKLRTVSNIETHDAKLLQIILIGQPDLVHTFNHHRLRHLRQRCFRSCILGPLDRAQTGGYIQHRLAVAGASNPDLFDDAAVGALYDVSGGVIRIINTICDNVMLSAFSKDTRAIDAELVRAVAKNAMALNEPAGQFVPSRAADTEHVSPAETAAHPGHTPSLQVSSVIEGQMRSNVERLEQKIGALADSHSSEIRMRELDSHLTKRIDDLHVLFTQLSNSQGSAGGDSHDFSSTTTEAKPAELLKAIDSKFNELQVRWEDVSLRSSKAMLDDLDSQLSRRLDTIVRGFERRQTGRGNADRQAANTEMRELNSQLSKRLRAMGKKFEQLRTEHEQADRENWPDGPIESDLVASEAPAIGDDISPDDNCVPHDDQAHHLDESLQRLRAQSSRTEVVAAALDKVKSHLVSAEVRTSRPSCVNHNRVPPVRRRISRTDTDRPTVGDRGDQPSSTFEDDVRLRIDRLRSRAEATLPNLTQAGKLLDSVRSLSRLAEESHRKTD